MARLAGRALLEDVCELLLSPFLLAGVLQVGAHERFEFDEEFDVEGRVVTPVVWQRTVRPVGGGMLLGERDAEIPLGDGGEAETMQTEESRGDLRVEEPTRRQSDVGEAGQVHHRVMDDPYRVADRFVELVPVDAGLGERDRVEQDDARVPALELNEPILMPVSKSRCAFRVGGEWTGRSRQRLAGTMVAFRRVGEGRHSPTRLGLQSWFRFRFSQRPFPSRRAWLIRGRAPMRTRSHRHHTACRRTSRE